MNQEEKQLLERTLKLSEENNRILKKINARGRWAFAWGIVKIVIFVVPLVAGYIFLEPYLKDAAANYQGIQRLLNL